MSNSSADAFVQPTTCAAAELPDDAPDTDPLLAPMHLHAELHALDDEHAPAAGPAAESKCVGCGMHGCCSADPPLLPVAWLFVLGSWVPPQSIFWNLIQSIIVPAQVRSRAPAIYKHTNSVVAAHQLEHAMAFIRFMTYFGPPTNR